MRVTKEQMQKWLIERETSDKILLNNLITILEIQKEACDKQIKILYKNPILNR